MNDPLRHAAGDLGGPRALLRGLSHKVVVAAGRYYVDHGVGYDPDADAAGRPAWWARCDMTGARAVQSLLVADCSSGAEALEKLGEKVAAAVKAHDRARRR